MDRQELFSFSIYDFDDSLDDIIENLQEKRETWSDYGYKNLRLDLDMSFTHFPDTEPRLVITGEKEE